MPKIELQLGHVYEAKKPIRNKFGLFNDREIVWIGRDELKYDSPSTLANIVQPIMSKKDFLEWAGRDITNIMPKGKWRKYEDHKTNKKH